MAAVFGSRKGRARAGRPVCGSLRAPIWLRRSPGLTPSCVLTSLLTSSRDAFPMKKSWPVQDAKARFSEFLQASLTEGPQVVTLRGVETAVLVPVNEWRDLRERARPGLKSLLLGPGPRGELNTPPRGDRRRRVPKPIG